MLMIPKESQSVFNIVSFDPGSTCLGVAVVTCDIVTLNILASDAWTINGSKLAGKDTWTEELFDNRTSRILAIEKNIIEILNYYKPLVICTESPFINSKFPAAGIALTEVMSTIRRAVMKYDLWSKLYMVPPSSVKNAVHAHGAAKKDIMKEKVMQLFSIVYTGNTPLDLLDEHSIDALAVSYAMLINLRKGV